MNQETLSNLSAMGIAFAPIFLQFANTAGDKDAEVEPNEKAEVRCVEDDDAPVHNGLHGRNDIKQHLKAPAMVQILQRDENWIEVVYVDEEGKPDRGWIIDKYLGECEEQAPEKSADSHGDGSTTVQTLEAMPKEGIDGTQHSSGPDPTAGELRLHFLDVGQGDSTLIECPGGTKILVDGGSTTSETADPAGYAAGKHHLDTVLGASRRVDFVFVTHPDRDHYNALSGLLKDVDVEVIQLVGSDDDYKSSTFDEWLSTNPEERRPNIEQPRHDSLSTPSSIATCGNARLHVLAAGVPATTKQDNYEVNTLSMVLHVSFGEFDAILTGDATTDTEKQVIAWYGADDPWQLDVELLKLGHHGSSATSTGTAWLAATRPKIAVVSSGENKQYGHPRKTIIERAADKTVSVAPHPLRWAISKTDFETITSDEAIYGTLSSGTIVVSTDGRRYTISTER